MPRLRTVRPAFQLITEKKKNFVITNIFVELEDGGLEFDAWIDEQGRDNGKNESDVIDTPPYIVESILRDFLGFPDSEIHHQSFDVHGNTTDGTLKDWSFAGGIYEVQKATDILDNILIQCGCQLYRDSQNRISLIVNDTIDYTRHNTTGSDKLDNGGFEQGDFTSWTEVNENGTSRKITIESTEVSEGSYSAKLEADSNDGTEIKIQQQSTDTDVAADTPYRLEFDYYFASRTAGNLKFNVYDADNGTSLFSNAAARTESSTNNGFETIKVDMMSTGSASSDVRINISLDNETTGILYIDNVKFYEVKQYYEFDKDSNLANLQIYQTPHNDILTEVYINYYLDRGSGDFAKCAFISSKKEFSGAYLTEDLNYYEWEIDVTDGTKFSAGDLIIINKEILTISSISSNTLTVNKHAVLSQRTAYRNSNNTSHDNGDPVYIVNEDSDDGSGSNSDTTREQEASETLWKYNIQNKLEIDADWIIDTSTAEKLRNYYFDYYSVPHWIVEFDCFFDASDIELGSIIRFDDSVMDSYIKIGGASWSGEDFRVKQITRNGNMDYHIVVEEVS